MIRYPSWLVFLVLLIGCGGGSHPSSSDENSSTTKVWYHPTTHTTWQWQLQGELNSNYEVDLYDIDLFDTDIATIASLHAQGRRVICYFSAGSWEDWREDSSRYPTAVLGNDMADWEGEKWVDISHPALRPILQARLDLAVKKGCDGVEPDNVDGYSNETGFPLTAEQQLAFNRFLSQEAHKRGLSIGLKNDLDQIEALEPLFDFALNEQCHRYHECDRLRPFIDANKPVFNAEYAKIYRDNPTKRTALCQDSRARAFQTLILPLGLDDRFRYSCGN